MIVVELVLYKVTGIVGKWLLHTQKEELSNNCCCSVTKSFFANLWTVACQAPLSMGFSRQGYWSGLPFPSPILKTRTAQTVKWVDSRLMSSWSPQSFGPIGGLLGIWRPYAITIILIPYTLEYLTCWTSTVLSNKNQINLGSHARRIQTSEFSVSPSFWVHTSTLVDFQSSPEVFPDRSAFAHKFFFFFSLIKVL